MGAAAGPGFSLGGGCANLFFCRKLHENERVWTLGESLETPLDPPMGGVPFQFGILPLLKHACEEQQHAGCKEVGRFHTTGEGRENPEETSPEAQNRSISVLIKGHVSIKNLEKSPNFLCFCRVKKS